MNAELKERQRGSHEKAGEYNACRRIMLQVMSQGHIAVCFVRQPKKYGAVSRAPLLLPERCPQIAILKCCIMRANASAKVAHVRRLCTHLGLPARCQALVLQQH